MMKAILKWRPIRSAPKDGTEIILFWPFITQDGYVTSGHWYDPNNGVPAYWYSSTVNSGATPPTYWMPMPLAPGGEVTFSNEAVSGQVSLNQTSLNPSE